MIRKDGEITEILAVITRKLIQLVKMFARSMPLQQLEPL